MGLMARVMEILFGNGRNFIGETAEVFRVNAEAQAGRDADAQGRALEQFAEEFTRARAGRFDRFMDGLNRVPRPALALGTIALFVAAMIDPVWFSKRMAGIALVPEPLWWLLGAVVSFYFGARHQAKGQAFQRDMLSSLARAPNVAAALAQLDRAAQPAQSRQDAVVPMPSDNPALDDWRASHG